MVKKYEKEKLTTALGDLENHLKDKVDVLRLIDSFDLFEDNIEQLNNEERVRFVNVLTKAKYLGIFKDRSSVSYSYLFMKLFLELNIMDQNVKSIECLLDEEERSVLASYRSLLEKEESCELSEESFEYLIGLAKNIRLSFYTEIQEGSQVSSVRSELDLNIVRLFTDQLQYQRLKEKLTYLLSKRLNMLNKSKELSENVNINAMFDYLSIVKFVTVSSSHQNDPQIKILTDFMVENIKSVDDLIPFRLMIFYCPTVVFSLDNEWIKEVKSRYEKSKLLFDIEYRKLTNEQKESLISAHKKSNYRMVYFVLLISIVIENIFHEDYKIRVKEEIEKELITPFS